MRDPILPYQINPNRLVLSAENKITNTPQTLRSEQLQKSLRWVVAVVACPYCDQPHEHPISQTAAWGHFTAPCTNGQHGYYLTNDVNHHAIKQWAVMPDKPEFLYGADAEAWGVPDGTPTSEIPANYQEWIREGAPNHGDQL